MRREATRLFVAAIATSCVVAANGCNAILGDLQDRPADAGGSDGDGAYDAAQTDGNIGSTSDSSSGRDGGLGYDGTTGTDGGLGYDGTTGADGGLGQDGSSISDAVAETSTDGSCLGGLGGDPYFSDVVLLMHFDGVNGSTNFVDATGRHTAAAHGSAQLGTASSQFGGSSLYLGNPSGGAYLTIANSTDWDLTSGDSTVEMWVNPTSLPSANPALLTQSPTSNDFNWTILLTNSPPFGPSAGALEFEDNGGPGLSTTNAVTTASWRHIAVVRSSGTTLLFINGVLGATGGQFYKQSSNPLYIGATNTNSFGSTYLWNGYIDELRITKGVARYTSNFTPPTSEFPSSGCSPPGDGGACEAGTTDCGGGCVDLQSDPNNCAVCGRACPGGTGVAACTAGLCNYMTLASDVDPGGIAADGQYVYWAYGSNNNSGGIVRASPDGGNQVTLASGQPAPYYLALDSTNVYWSNRGSTTEVMSCAKTGCSNTPTTIGATSSPYQVAVDSTYVYWADSNEGLYRAAKTGGGQTPLRPGSIFGVVADGTNVYWNVDGGVGKMAPDGGNEMSLGGGTGGLGIDGTNVYWASPTEIGWVAKTGVSSNPSLAGVQKGLWVVSDGTNVYWADIDAGTISRIHPDGTGRVVLASTGSNSKPDFLAVDATNVYWTDQGFFGSTDKAVRSTTK